MAGYEPDLQVSDAENLTFPANTFDVVYSYGVMHHSADVPRCLNEAWRVLKPGGQARIMLYHHPSLTGIMLWLRFGLSRGKSFSKAEVYRMMKHFDQTAIQQVFSPGDLLLNKPSSRFHGRFYRIVWALYPRFLMRAFCGKLGLFLLVSAQKPLDSEESSVPSLK
jgi:SAM-dependent methyltransferase